MKPLRIVILVFWGLAAGLYGAWRVYQFKWYLGMIPAHLQISYPMHISGQSDLFEGCGIAAFRIEKETTRRISAEGTAFLNADLQPRKHRDAYYDTLGAWKPTPYPISDDGDDATVLSFALGCSDASARFSRRLKKAAQETGSFYSEGYETLLLVIPQERIVVFAHHG